MKDSNKREWFAEWFDHPLYLKVYSHRDEAEAKTCVGTILENTGLAALSPADVRVMDIACGAGRHALEFARQGFDTTANDLSPYLIGCAGKRAGEEGLPLVCTRQDMRSLAARNAYDLVVQLFSSFGYFDSRDEDLQVLRNVRRALKHKGWYVLDLMNPAYLKNNFLPSSSKTVEGLEISETRRIADGRVFKHITIDDSGRSVTFEESVRLYDRKTIEGMLEAAGFEVLRVLGDYGGAVFDPARSPRMLIFSRRR